MQIRVFTRPEEIRAVFPTLKPLFARVPERDFTMDDLKHAALAGRLVLGGVEQAGAWLAAFAFEYAAYPRLRALNIVAFAGERLDAIAHTFLGAFRCWCQQAGIQAIEARCGAAMARLLRRYGFNTPHHIVRMTWDD